MGSERSPLRSTDLNLVIRPNREVQTFRDSWNDNATSSGNVKHVFHFEEKLDGHLA